MAQILRFHQWPVAITGNYTYTDSSGACQGTHSASDAGLGDYDWGNMPASISTSSPTAQKQAVGRLIYHCGVTVNMDFEAASDTGGSGASSGWVPDAFLDFFSYNSGDVEYRSGYTTSQWYAKISTEITNNRPIYYAFCDDSDQGCHAVVCDGAQNGNEIHINMGWGGYATDWYNMDNISTPNGYNYNSAHHAIFQIGPSMMACTCTGTDPVLSCTISTGQTYSCTGKNSIRLIPGFHAETGSTVTLRP